MKKQHIKPVDDRMLVVVHMFARRQFGHDHKIVRDLEALLKERFGITYG